MKKSFTTGWQTVFHRGEAEMSEGILQRVGSIAANGSTAEGRVARVVVDDPHEVLGATVADLAKAAGVSQASVIRFARSVGCDGWPPLRLALAQELSRRAVELERSDIAEGTINDDDCLHDVVQKIAFHEARSIEQTARLINEDTLELVARTVAEGPRTLVFGVGASALAAMDLEQKLERIGLPCRFSPDTHQQLMHASLAPRGALALGISFSGRTAEVENALRLAAERGAVTVALTGVEGSPVGEAADHVLLCHAREAEFRAGALASRLVQLAVVDFLFVRVAQLRLGDVESTLEQTRRAVAAHRKQDLSGRSRESQSH